MPTLLELANRFCDSEPELSRLLRAADNAINRGHDYLNQKTEYPYDPAVDMECGGAFLDAIHTLRAAERGEGE